jgi:hypothetical protein
MICLNCRFYDFNHYLDGYGTCEPQDEDFPADHSCNLSPADVSELESLTGHTREKS